jgi:hypothetical protein
MYTQVDMQGTYYDYMFKPLIFCWCCYWQGCQNWTRPAGRTGRTENRTCIRFDRLVRKTVMRENRDKTGKNGLPGRSDQFGGLDFLIFFFVFNIFLKIKTSKKPKLETNRKKERKI